MNLEVAISNGKPAPELACEHALREAPVGEEARLSFGGWQERRCVHRPHPSVLLAGGRAVAGDTMELRGSPPGQPWRSRLHDLDHALPTVAHAQEPMA